MSHILRGKTLVVGALVLLSSLAFTGTVHAAATAANTNTCYAGNPVAVVKGQNSFSATWNGDNTFTITAAKPLASNVQLFASDYVLTSPDYKGGCFSHDASTGTSPQTWFKTETIVLNKGFVGSKTVTVALPTTCENVQADLYWGKADSENGIMPLNDTVTSAGHDQYGYIVGNIMQTALNPACKPGQGSETPSTPTPTTPVTPVTPVVAVAPAATLVDTGVKVSLVSIIASITAAAAIFVGTRRTKVTK